MAPQPFSLEFWQPLQLVLISWTGTGRPVPGIRNSARNCDQDSILSRRKKKKNGGGVGEVIFLLFFFLKLLPPLYLKLS